MMARPWASKPARLSVPPPVALAPVVPPQPASLPERAKLRGHVVSEDGQAPVAAAHLVVRSGGGAPRESRSDEQGHFEVDDLDVGPASVEVTADGFAPATRTITLSASTPDLDVSVAKALPSGQVRGLVRDFGGKPVGARIRIEPLGIDVALAPDGTFQANVAPGTYDVVIHADGYVDQKRHVVVERDGVTMLNVELRKGR